MRPFEFVLLGLLALLWLWLTWRLKYRQAFAPRTAQVVAAVFALVLLLHFAREGLRWQLFPAYACVGLMGAAIFSPRAIPALGRWPKLAWLYVSVLLVALWLSALLAYALPVPRLPAPRGPYPVGTMTYTWTDDAREEAYTDAPGDKRTIVVQVWYPAKNDPPRPVMPWVAAPDAVSNAFSASIDLPGWVFSHLRLAQGHSHLNAAIAEDAAPYPVLLYSHGWGAFREVATDQHEDLASHGYVVFAADHVYGALVSVLPDGTVRPQRPDALPSDGAPNRQPRIEQLVDTYRGDLQFMLDQIARLNADTIPSPLAGKLDLARVGLYGHSTGGAAVFETTLLDPRIKATVGQDIWGEPISPEVWGETLKAPLLMLESEGWTKVDSPEYGRFREFVERIDAPITRVEIPGTKHRDFTLAGLLSPIRALSLTGAVPPHELLRFVQDVQLAFFDAHLRPEQKAIRTLDEIVREFSGRGSVPTLELERYLPGC